MLRNFLIIPAAIPTGALTMLLREMIDTPPLVALKAIKILSM